MILKGPFLLEQLRKKLQKRKPSEPRLRYIPSPTLDIRSHYRIIDGNIETLPKRGYLDHDCRAGHCSDNPVYGPKSPRRYI